MRLVVLDSFRGLFALMVVLLHGPFQSHLYYLTAIRNSGVFVDFFFVLSGFVLALAYQDRAGSPRHAAGFMIRRIGRLWPLALVALGVLLVLTGGAGDDTGFTLQAAFLVQAFRNDTLLWLNFPSWSISAELAAYAVFALAMLAPRGPTLPLLVAGLGAALVLGGAIDPGFGASFDHGLFRAVACFALGHLAWQLRLRLGTGPLPHASLCEIACVGLILAQISQTRLTGVPPELLLTFAVTILVFSWEGGIISRLLSAAPFRALGRWSYGIYILHMPVLVALCLGLQKAGEALGRSFFDPDAPAGILPLIDLGPATDLAHLGSVALTVACAALAWHLVEGPGQALARQLARRVEHGPLPHLATRIPRHRRLTGPHLRRLPAAPSAPSRRPGTPGPGYAAPAAPSVARTAASPPPAHRHPAPAR